MIRRHAGSVRTVEAAFAQELADHYVVMERGEVIASGPGSEMQEKNVRSLVAI